MLSFDALVRGRVTYDSPDGQGKRVPQGRCSVEVHEGFVGLTWIEAGATKTAVITIEVFEAALDVAALLITDSSQLRAVKKAASENSLG